MGIRSEAKERSPLSGVVISAILAEFGSDETLFANLDSAIAQKQAILNNRGNYYYTEMVQHKKRTYVGPFVGEPKVWYEPETRFNHAQYNQDLANADSRIHQYQTAVNTRINGLQDQARSINSQVQDAAEQTLALNRQISSYQSKYAHSVGYNSDLNSAIQQERAKLYAMQSELSQKQGIISALPSQIQSEKSAIEQEKIRAEQLRTKVEELNKEFAELGRDIFEHVISLDNGQRALLLAELFDREDAVIVTNLIKKLAFDCEVLAELAITKNHTTLLDLAIEKQANFEDYALEKFGNKTLLQYAISIGNPEIIAKILAIPNLDLTCTLLNSLKQNDIATIVKLLEHDPSLGHKQMHGLTLLDSAIWSGKYEVAQKIVQLDEGAKDSLNANGETAFKTAVRSLNPDMITLVGGLGVRVEVKKIVKEKGDDWLSKLYDLNIISTEMTQSLLAEAIQEQDSFAIKYFSAMGASLIGEIPHNLDI